MNQSIAVQRLANHIEKIETELTAIRRELSAFAKKPQTDSPVSSSKNAVFVDKNLIKRQMRDLFATLSIQGQAIGAEALQNRMSDAGLTSNELSQSIIAAREE